MYDRTVKLVNRNHRLEKVIAKLIDLSIASMENQKNTNASIKNLEMQVLQLAKQLHNSYIRFSIVT